MMTIISNIPFERLNKFGNLIGATSNVCSLSNCGCVPKSHVSSWQLILSCSSLPPRSLFNLQVGGAPLSEKDTESQPRHNLKNQVGQVLLTLPKMLHELCEQGFCCPNLRNMQNQKFFDINSLYGFVRLSKRPTRDWRAG